MNTKQKNTANEIFSHYPILKELYINPKGEFFTTADLATNSLSKGEKYQVVKREVVTPEAEKATDFTVQDLQKELEGVVALPVAEQLLLDEQNGKNRKTAKEAIQQKINDLNATLDES